MAVTVYASAPLMLNAHQWSTSYGVLLVGSGYTLDRDAHVYVSDLSGELALSGNYTRKAIAAPGTSLGTHLVNFNADNTTWTAITGTPAAVYAAIVFYNSGSDATSGLIAHYLLTTPVTTNGGDFTIKWNAGSSSGAVFQMVATVV